MPDPLKLAALEAARFRIVPTCGSCAHFKVGVVRGTTAWGWCHAIPWTHAKHTGGARVSVRGDGTCPIHSPTSESVADLERSGFGAFVNPK